MFTLTPQHEKLLDASEAIRLEPDKIEAVFMARQLVQATLPHSNPKDDLPEWTRRNGNLTLSIIPGRKTDLKTGERMSVGYPYGIIPRLLLFWMTTEAVRTKNPRLELGNNLSDFMKQLTDLAQQVVERPPSQQPEPLLDDTKQQVKFSFIHSNLFIIKFLSKGQRRTNKFISNN